MPPRHPLLAMQPIQRSAPNKTCRLGGPRDKRPANLYLVRAIRRPIFTNCRKNTLQKLCGVRLFILL